MTDVAQTDLLPLSVDGANSLALAENERQADAKAEVESWAPNTRKSYVAGWKHFTEWCMENRCPGLPASPDTVVRYLEHLVEGEGKTMATARARVAAISAAHRLGGHSNPVTRPRIKSTMKRLAREHGKPRRQAKGLTAEALAAVKATARIQRVYQGKRRRKESVSEAARRALLDLALLQVMRDGLLRRSEAAILTWGNIEVHTDGSGRLHVDRSKTDPEALGVVLFLGEDAVDALLAIRPDEVVIDASASVFGLSESQIGRRIRAAAKMAGLGEGYSGHSPRVGMAQDLSAHGSELPALMTAGRWESAEMPAKYTEAQAVGRGAVAQYYKGRRRAPVAE